MVLCNFTNTYSFVFQDEAQRFRWNCAIHPLVIYFRKELDVLNTENENLMMILDHSKRYSILVHTFHCHLMKFIENAFKSPLKKILL
jgi:hypothetical protein